jgi:hypothetical protein
MSVIRFFPIRWFESGNWKSIQIIGTLENRQPVYIRVAFKPYFTVRYPDNVTIEDITDAHEYLITETPIADVSILNEAEKLYRFYVANKDDYYDSIKFYKRNGMGEILDETQEIKSKFFAEKKINPGAWQQANDLRTLYHNVTMNSSYTVYELEFYSRNIVSLDLNIPIPQGRTIFFDIEVIPSDDISFPDAEKEGPVDNIFAISLVDGNRYIVFILTDKELPEKFTIKGTPYQVEIVRVADEKALIQSFFDELQLIRPNRMVSMNGRRFDINYIGARCRALGIILPTFTPILNYEPYFYETTIVQKEPIPFVDQVWALSAPSISQIDLLDFYRRLLPQLGNHRLETLSQTILKRGKTGLGIQEMFAKYRHGTTEDLLEIIGYSIIDSILLYELWATSQIDQKLAVMSNEWKNDAEYVLTHGMNKLFDDLMRYIQPNIPDKLYNPGKPIETERKAGIHRNVYFYSLSPIYLMFINQQQDVLSNTIVNYFQNTNDGIIPFESGYFNVTFNQVQEFILSRVEQIVWIEKNSLATTVPLNFLPNISFAPLVIVSQKSWIVVDQTGMIFKKGMNLLVRPPFLLLQKYVDYLIDFLIKHPDQPVTFPNLETNLQDFTLEDKISAQDFVSPPKRKLEIVQQLRELKSPIPTTWRKVKYIKTTEGPVIEEIYSQNPEKYIALIDQKYYNNTLQNALKTIF